MGVLSSNIATVTISAATMPNFTAMLEAGHADIGLALGGVVDDGHGHGGDPTKLELHIHDEESDEEYAPDEALFYVGSAGITVRNGAILSSDYDFLGVDPNQTFYVLPAIENPDLLFLGIGGEEIETGLLLNDLATLRLKSVSGPGNYAVWQATDTGPIVAMSTADGITEEDSLDVLAGSHRHFNMAFSKPGRYAITFEAKGTLDSDGDVLSSGEATFYFQVGNFVESLEVQRRATQRSYIRHLDLAFGSEDGLQDLLQPSRVNITRFDLNGLNGVPVVNPAMSVADGKLLFDFGTEGLGGNRNSNIGDGYYRVSLDIDGDGDMDASYHFFRILGDVDGNGRVDEVDLNRVTRAMERRGFPNTSNPNDVNGDGVVNSVDKVLVQRQMKLTGPMAPTAQEWTMARRLIRSRSLTFRLARRTVFWPLSNSFHDTPS